MTKSDEHMPKGPWLPPRWLIRLAWSVHRGVYRGSRGRVGLSRPHGNRYGTLRLTATGRRTGQQRSVILGYFEDGANLVSLAMNGWASLSLPGGSTGRRTRTRPFDPVDGRQLRRAVAPQQATSGRGGGARSREIDRNLDGDQAARRSSETAVVVLEAPTWRLRHASAG